MRYPKIVRSIAAVLVLVSACSLLVAQPAKPAFEVAAIRHLGPSGPPCCMGGGPATPTPMRIRYQRVTLMQIIMRAYNMKAFQVIGPEWLKQDKYEVLANVPSETTQEEFASMHQSLLEERWGLKMHHETMEFPAYALYLDKGGPKMAVSKVDPMQGSMRSYPLTGGFTLDFVSWQMRGLAFTLEWFMDRDDPNPLFSNFAVVDRTGLTERYDFSLTFATGSLASRTEFSPPDVRTALKEIGLKLEKSDEPFDVIKIDSVNRIPTEN